jgi:thioesterase domain-containing protein
VLGHSSAAAIDPERNLLELGFSSVMAVELQQRLLVATGVDLAGNLRIEDLSPVGIAADLDAAQNGVRAGTGPITRMVKDAHARGELPDVVPMLTATAGSRPSYTVAHAGPPASVSLVSEGPPPTLLCIPSFLVGSGVHQFVRFAAGFPQRRAISAVSLPGFARDEEAPGSWDAAIGSLAQAARRTSNGRDLVLVGYSVGGVLAEAVAGVLEAEGTPPAGIVLIDTYEPDSDDQLAVFSWALSQVLERDHAYQTIDDDGLLTMGAYLRLLSGWTPASPSVPSLLITAAGAGQPNWRRWQRASSQVSIDADHFSILEQHASMAAAAVDAWLQSGSLGLPADQAAAAPR